MEGHDDESAAATKGVLVDAISVGNGFHCATSSDQLMEVSQEAERPTHSDADDTVLDNGGLALGQIVELGLLEGPMLGVAPGENRQRTLSMEVFDMGQTRYAASFHSPPPDGAEAIGDPQHTREEEVSRSAGVRHGVEAGPNMEHGGHGERVAGCDSPGAESGQAPLTRRWRTAEVLSRMPLKLAPFIAAMFGWVAALRVGGWVSRLNELLQDMLWGSNAFGAAYIMTTVTTLAGNVLNNQPMTILFADTLSAGTIEVENSRVALAALYGTIAGSNIAACLTPVGALAGLMFQSILRSYGYSGLSAKVFVKYGAIVTVPTIVVSATATACMLAWTRPFVPPTLDQYFRWQ